MLKDFRIKCFQSHSDTALEFDSGVNVIFGLSQSGKTAILRALSLLITNRPLGARFFSDSVGKKGATELDLTLIEGDRINLKKEISLSKEGKKEVRSSAYSLNDDVDSYKAFGDKIPDQIETKLNLSDLNVQKQFDEPFLICSSPGEVARVFNRVTRLEKVDQWSSELTRQVNTGRSEVKILESQQTETEEELKKYEDVLEIEREVQRAERLETKRNSIEIQIIEIEKLMDEILLKQKDMLLLQDWLSVERLYQGAEKLLEARKSREEEFKALSILANNLSEIKEDKEYYQAIVTAKDLVEEGLQLIKDTREKKEECRQVGQVLSKLEQIYSEISVIKQEKEGFVSEYALILKELGKCPTCFSIIDKQKMEEIIRKI